MASFPMKSTYVSDGLCSPTPWRY